MTQPVLYRIGPTQPIRCWTPLWLIEQEKFNLFNMKNKKPNFEPDDVYVASDDDPVSSSGDELDD